MKKLLVGTAAVALGAVALSGPAAAQGLSLDVGGHAKVYGVYHNQNNNFGDVDERKLDMLRTTEVHFTGETTLDNGLTVGAHVEALIGGNRHDDADRNDITVDESYIYMSGAWGRVNVGNEDGAAYLLQVAAPSADSNIDGIRQFLNPVIYDTGFTGEPVRLDYAQDFARGSDKLTYLTPVFEGFQAGVSYTPKLDGMGARTFGVSTRNNLNEFEHGWDAAARYEGQFDQFGLTFGAGYSYAKLEEKNDPLTDGDFDSNRRAWNVGGNVNFGAFNLGAVYTRDNMGGQLVDAADDVKLKNRQWVLGGDYTTGPFKLGVSYLNDKIDNIAGENDDMKTHRWSGGVTYTYGPGMTFRGSIHHLRHKVDNNDNPRATSFLLGTQINF